MTFICVVRCARCAYQYGNLTVDNVLRNTLWTKWLKLIFMQNISDINNEFFSSLSIEYWIHTFKYLKDGSESHCGNIKSRNSFMQFSLDIIHNRSVSFIFVIFFCCWKVNIQQLHNQNHSLTHTHRERHNGLTSFQYYYILFESINSYIVLMRLNCKCARIQFYPFLWFRMNMFDVQYAVCNMQCVFQNYHHLFEK